MTLPTLALTLIQPWGTAIIHHGKDIENRTWEPYASQLRPGDRLWIHAGKKRDGGACEYVAGICAGHDDVAFEEMAEALETVPVGALLGHVRFDGVVRASDSPWFFGPVGWRLSDPVALPTPMFCRGAQGLWTPDEEVMHNVRRTLEATRCRHCVNGIRPMSSHLCDHCHPVLP